MPDIRDLIKKQKALYKSIVSVDCVLLNETVYFTSEGFFHLTHKSKRKRRPIDETYLKLMCLTYAAEIVKDANKVLETRSQEEIIEGKKKLVIYHALIDGKKRNNHIVVIVRKIGTGKLKFRSVTATTHKRYFTQ